MMCLSLLVCLVLGMSQVQLAEAVVLPRQPDDPIAVSSKRFWSYDTQKIFNVYNSSTLVLPRPSTVVYTPLLAMHAIAYHASTQRIIVFGGNVMNPFDGNNAKPNYLTTDALYYYDVRKNKWYTQKSFSSITPEARLDHVAWMSGEFFFIQGGTNTKHALVDSWFMRNRTWTRVQHDGPALYGHSVCVTRTSPFEAFAFGGRSDTTFFNRLYSVAANGTFAIVSGTTGPAPLPRAWHAAASLTSPTARMMYIVGGSDATSRRYNDIYGYNAALKLWKAINVDGRSNPVKGYDGAMIEGVAISTMDRHACGGVYPTLLCFGGSPTGTATLLAFDVILARWIRTEDVNPVNKIPVIGNKAVIVPGLTGGEPEFYSVGGLTGAPLRFIKPIAIQKVSVATERCPSGFFDPDAAGRCFRCPRGSSSQSAVDPHHCTACKPGTYDTGVTCRDCPVSTYNPRNASFNVSSCFKCPTGTFTIGTGSRSLSQCITCPLGYYILANGCVKCPEGTYGNQTGTLGTACQPCDYGTYSLSGALSCSTCPAGTSTGPFQRRLFPFAMRIRQVGVTFLPSIPAPGGCPIAGTIVATVLAQTWFYITVDFIDIGTDGTAATGTVLNWITETQGSGVNPAVSVSYDGTPTRMYYNCMAQSPSVCATFVTVNASSPANAASDLPGCNGGNQNQYRSYAMRFDEAATGVRVWLRSGMIHPAVVYLNVISIGTKVQINGHQLRYVIGQPVDLNFVALDLLGNVDYTATDTWTLTAGGVPMSVTGLGGPYLTTLSITFVGGRKALTIYFGGLGAFNIPWATTRASTPYTYTLLADGIANFEVDQAQNLLVELNSVNVTSGGMVYVNCSLIGNGGVGSVTQPVNDGFSWVEVVLSSTIPFVSDPNLYIAEPKGVRQARVTAGTATFAMQVYSQSNATAQQGWFQCRHLSGLTPLLTTVVSKPWFFVANANGTMLEFVTVRYPFPAVLSANRTFYLEVINRDRISGNVDSSRNVPIRFDLSNCPGVKLRMLNHTGPAVSVLRAGQGVFAMQLVGRDQLACRIGVFEYGYRGPQKAAQGAWTTAFSMLSGLFLSHNSCPNTACGPCQYLQPGTEFNITVSVRSSTGAVVTSDDYTIVKMVPFGNATGAVEVTDQYEKRVTGGTTYFWIRLLPSTKNVSFVFLAGSWSLQPFYNRTFWRDPTFRALIAKTKDVPVFVKGFINPVFTCEFPVKVSATQLLPASSIARWIPNAEVLALSVIATNQRQELDPSVATTMTLRIDNCHHGYTAAAGDLTWQVLLDGSTTWVPFFQGISLGPLKAGTGKFSLIPTVLTQTDMQRGVLDCSIRVFSGTLKAAYFEGFEIRRLFGACTLCPPATWSPGGNGRNTVLAPFHPGGCVDCMVGTFSTTSGGTAETSCQVCQTGDGFTPNNHLEALEGITQCGPCQYGSAGVPGGGFCTAIVSAFTTRGGNGRLGRYCSSAICNNTAACPAGTYRIDCTGGGFITSGTCTQVMNAGMCTWNVGLARCEGSRFNCVGCPPGYVNPGATNNWWTGACQACEPGGWSANASHTTVTANTWYQYERWRSGASVTHLWRCTGQGTDICPNGTYSASYAATGPSTCLTCPKGTYAHIAAIYYNVNQYGLGAMDCPCDTQTPLLNYNYAGGGACTFQCPVRRLGLWGAKACQPCPAGTYNNFTGRWDALMHCLPCPAGTYCPAGSIEPIQADTINSAADQNGRTPPDGVSFDANAERLLCASAYASDHPGYLPDGRFSTFKQHLSQGGTDLDTFVPVWKQTGLRVAQYVPLDRLNQAGSGSVYCNATACGMWQRFPINEVLSGDLVARIWVYNRLIGPKVFNSTVITKVNKTSINVTTGAKIYTFVPTPVKLSVQGWVNTSKINRVPLSSTTAPFAGFDVILYSSKNLTTAKRQRFRRSIPLTARFGQWHLVEMKMVAQFPVVLADFAFGVQGYVQGSVWFDDASVRPALTRVCNCSSGFFYNVSRKPASHRCQRCPPGFQCSGGIIRRCENSWSVSGQSGCNVCRDGWLCDADGRGRGIPCAKYSYRLNDTEQCRPCPLGFACPEGAGKFQCDNGRYGDGGLTCITCKPGFYAPSGSPQRECLRCPAGSSSEAGRSSCHLCPVDTYSPDGSTCKQCPSGQFAPAVGSAYCRPCTSLHLPTLNVTVYRNDVVTLHVVPKVCEESYDWLVESVHHVSSKKLGTAAPSRVAPAVVYTAQSLTGIHELFAHVTSENEGTLQRTLMQVRVDNRFPIVKDDDLTITHPKSAMTLDLSYVLFNDWDPDRDELFFASAVLVAPTFGSTNLVIDTATRKGLYLDLPVNFTGPALITYVIMDQYQLSLANCKIPDCQYSNVSGVIRVTAREAPPVALPDSFTALNGQVYTFDVLANDYDPEGDDLVISTAGVSTFGARPYPTLTCVTCPAACQGVPSCTCSLDANRGACWPSNNRPWTISYTPPAASCGVDTFSYTIKTNDGQASAIASTKVKRCFCGTHATGVDIVFVLDPTAGIPAFLWQLSLVEAVQRRSSQLTAFFRYALFSSGRETWHRNLTNVYLPTDITLFPPNAFNYPYQLGTSLSNLASLPLIGAPRKLGLVIISGSESVNSVVGPAGILGSPPFSAKIFPVTVNPLNHVFGHTKQLNSPVGDGWLLTSWDKLASQTLAQDIMDELCIL